MQSDGAVIAVVGNQDDGFLAMQACGSKLAAGHQRAAIADDRQHLALRIAQRRSHRHRHARAHRTDDGGQHLLAAGAYAP